MILQIQLSEWLVQNTPMNTHYPGSIVLLTKFLIGLLLKKHILNYQLNIIIYVIQKIVILVNFILNIYYAVPFQIILYVLEWIMIFK